MTANLGIFNETAKYFPDILLPIDRFAVSLQTEWKQVSI